MVGKNEVTITIVGDANSLSRAVGSATTSLRDLDNKVDGTGGRLSSFGANVTSSSQSLASGLAKVGLVAAVGFGAAGAAAVSFGLDAARAAEESAQVTRQTGAVIASMGASAWTSAGQVETLAGKLSAMSGVDDELIQSGQNVLLTFGNIRNEVGRGNDIFDRATTSALDMSVALGQDMQASVTQLGKALNDPIAGISALSRVGIQFTEDQKAMIEQLVASGDVLGAQKVILGEVERQFSGSAEAQATASQKMSVAWGNLQEEIGGRLLPVFEEVSDWVMKTGIPALEDFSEWFQREGVPRIREFGQWLGRNVLPILATLGSFVKDSLVPALVDLGQWFSEHERVLAAVAIGIAAMLVPAFVAWAASAIAAAAATIVALAPLLLIGAAVALIAYLVITHWDTIKNATMVVFEAVRGAIETAFNWVRDNWPLLLAILTGPIGLAVLAIVSHWDTIKNGFTAVKDWIFARVEDIVGFITGIPGRIASAASSIGSTIIGGITSGITGIGGFVSDIAGSVKRAINSALHLPFTIHGPGPLPDFTIPAFHQGGIFHAPQGQREGLAMLLDGERVSRPGQGGGINVTIIVNGSLMSERDFIGKVRDELGRGGFGGVW